MRNGFRNISRLCVMVVTLLMSASVYALPVPAASTPPSTDFNHRAQADCPPGVRCKVVPAALKDGGCNYSTANRPADLPIYGINEHTTEGTLDAALAEAQDTNNCVSWNYLIGQDGTVYVSVPSSSLAYDVGNWWFNTHYVQVEHVGFAEDCSTLTPAERTASVRLDRYLIGRFHIKASSETIIGHDSVPAVSDASMAARHWDPGVCWPWVQYLNEIGAPIVPTAGPHANVVTIRTDNSHEPTLNCPGLTFTNCTDAAQDITNFVSLNTPKGNPPVLLV